MFLVLAGGNALGAYQGGAYQALHERGLAPDWIAGASIGAINGAIIAGNHPQQRIQKLKQFWMVAEQFGNPIPPTRRHPQRAPVLPSGRRRRRRS